MFTYSYLTTENPITGGAVEPPQADSAKDRIPLQSPPEDIIQKIIKKPLDNKKNIIEFY